MEIKTPTPFQTNIAFHGGTSLNFKKIGAKYIFVMNIIKNNCYNSHELLLRKKIWYILYDISNKII